MDYPYQKLENLRDNVLYWDYRFKHSAPCEAMAMQKKLIEAKKIVKQFKQEHLPHLLIPPTPPVFKPSVRMSDWCEELEEYNF